MMLGQVAPQLQGKAIREVLESIQMVAVVEVRANPPSPSSTTTAMYTGVPAVRNTRERGLEVGRMEDRAVPPRLSSAFAGEEVAALAPHTPCRLTELPQGRVPPAAKAMGKYGRKSWVLPTRTTMERPALAG